MATELFSLSLDLIPVQCDAVHLGRPAQDQRVVLLHHERSALAELVELGSDARRQETDQGAHDEDPAQGHEQPDAERREQRVLSDHATEVGCLAFNPDGTPVEDADAETKAVAPAQAENKSVKAGWKK